MGKYNKYLAHIGLLTAGVSPLFLILSLFVDDKELFFRIWIRTVLFSFTIGLFSLMGPHR